MWTRKSSNALINSFRSEAAPVLHVRNPLMLEISQNAPQMSITGDLSLFPSLVLFPRPLCYPLTLSACSFPPWSHLKPYRHYPFPTPPHRLVFQLHRLRIRSSTFFGPGLLRHPGPEPNPEVNPGFLASAFALILASHWPARVEDIRYAPSRVTWRFGRQLGVLRNALILGCPLFLSVCRCLLSFFLLFFLSVFELILGPCLRPFGSNPLKACRYNKYCM